MGATLSGGNAVQLFHVNDGASLMLKVCHRRHAMPNLGCTHQRQQRLAAASGAASQLPHRLEALLREAELGETLLGVMRQARATQARQAQERLATALEARCPTQRLADACSLLLRLTRGYGLLLGWGACDVAVGRGPAQRHAPHRDRSLANLKLQGRWKRLNHLPTVRPSHVR